MSTPLKITLAQINPIVGDIDGNAEKILTILAQAEHKAADLVVFPEMVLSGYPVEDLVQRWSFVQACEDKIQDLAAKTKGMNTAALIGSPTFAEQGVYNSALLLANGKVADKINKIELPNYGVFDEVRVFTSGDATHVMEFKGQRLAVMICEDIWHPRVLDQLLPQKPDLMIALNGSPFDHEKIGVRFQRASDRIGQSGLPLIYVNMLGGQDEIVFEGKSFAMNSDQELVVQADSWQEDLVTIQWDGNMLTTEESSRTVDQGAFYDIYHALVLGVRDYVAKNGFKGLVLGLSGGIDSALTAAVAVDAVGADNVICVMMPSPYTSEESIEDAEAIAHALGVDYRFIPIEAAMQVIESSLNSHFEGLEKGITEENIQSRLRGLTLMAFSNKFGHMVVSTGNKSEMAVGYATLYGDMNGGYNPLKDVYKIQVFELVKWRNANHSEHLKGPSGQIIPDRVLTKPPSAELRPDQKDEDSLPPYATLDDILHGLIEEELSVEEISKRGFDIALVRKIWNMLKKAEYKRYQAPPGVKISTRAFGRDRRYPLTNAFNQG